MRFCFLLVNFPFQNWCFGQDRWIRGRQCRFGRTSERRAFPILTLFKSSHHHPLLMLVVILLRLRTWTYPICGFRGFYTDSSMLDAFDDAVQVKQPADNIAPFLFFGWHSCWCVSWAADGLFWLVCCFLVRVTVSLLGVAIFFVVKISVLYYHNTSTVVNFLKCNYVWRQYCYGKIFGEWDTEVDNIISLENRINWGALK